MTSPAATPTPEQFVPGWVKQDLHHTLAVAVRTSIVTANNMKDWGVMTLDHGGHYATWDDVSTWPDVDANIVYLLRANFSGEGGVSVAAGIGAAVDAQFSGDGGLGATTA